MFFGIGVLIHPVMEDTSQLKVIGASLFKNGYSVVTRAAELKGPGEYILEGFPQAALGTLWLTASPGTTIERAVNTMREIETEWTASSMDDVLRAAIGKRVLFLRGDNSTVTGELKSVAGEIAIVVSGPTTIIVPKSSIASVTVHGQIEWKRKSKATTRAIRVKINSKGPGKLYTVSLERGMMWTPGYAVDISDPKSLTIVAKATVINDLADFENADLQFVTGFPNLPYLGINDPFSSPMDIMSFTNSMLGQGFGTGGGRRDDARSMMQNQAPNGDFAEAFTPTGEVAGQLEDLFFYKQPKVTMKQADRGYFILFSHKAEYKHVYTWELADSVMSGDVYRGEPEVAPDIWHSLKFKNTGNLPYTTGIAVTMKNGELLGQDMLKYTGVGSEATLRITKALELRADSTEEEVDRTVEQIVLGNSKTNYFLVTMKSTLTVQNRKNEDATIEITKYLTGEVLAAEGNPKIEKTTKGLRDVNPRAKVEWQKTVKPGETLTLKLSHKVYLRAG